MASMLLVLAVLLAVFVVPGPWNLLVVAAGLAGEVAESLFLLRLSRRRRAAVGPEAMLGQVAVVAAPCRPEGQVRVKGELWRARCAEGAATGERVRITGIEELTLLVQPERRA